MKVFVSDETKKAITNALLRLPQTQQWKNKFAKFGIIKFEVNSDVAYNGPATQMWAIQNEKLNVRYYQGMSIYIFTVSYLYFVH